MLPRAPWMMLHAPRIRWLSFTRPWRSYSGNRRRETTERCRRERKQAQETATYRRSKHVIPVVDKDPSHPPSGDQPAFSQTTAGEYGDIAAERRQGRTTAAWEDLSKQQHNSFNGGATQDGSVGSRTKAHLFQQVMVLTG